MPIAPWNPGGYYPFTYGSAPPQNNPQTGAGGLGGSTLPNYNVSPSPQAGQGAYGSVPGNISIPPSIWKQATGAVPALGNTTQLTNNIMSEIQGDINPQALKNMQDAAAAYGVQSGMLGSNAIPNSLLFNKNLRNIGLDTMAIQRQGQQDYTGLLNAVGGQQTPQALAAEIAAHNAQLNAAPDPTLAALQQLNNYMRGLNLGQQRASAGGGGGYINPGGGTGAYAQQPFHGGTPGPAPYVPTSQIPNYPSPSQSLYPGTDVPGLPSLDSLLGPQNQNYSPSAPIDYGGMGTYGMDASSPNYWNFDQTAQPSFDPSMVDMNYFDPTWDYNSLEG